MRASFPFHELECQRHQAAWNRTTRQDARGGPPRRRQVGGRGTHLQGPVPRRRPPDQGARGASHGAPRSLGLLPRGALAARAAAGAGLAAGAGPAGGAAAAAAAAERGGRARPLPLRLQRREHLFGTHFVDPLVLFGTTLAGNLCLDLRSGSPSRREARGRAEGEEVEGAGPSQGGGAKRKRGKSRFFEPGPGEGAGAGEDAPVERHLVLELLRAGRGARRGRGRGAGRGGATGRLPAPPGGAGGGARARGRGGAGGGRLFLLPEGGDVQVRAPHLRLLSGLRLHGATGGGSGGGGLGLAPWVD